MFSVSILNVTIKHFVVSLNLLVPAQIISSTKQITIPLIFVLSFQERSLVNFWNDCTYVNTALSITFFLKKFRFCINAADCPFMRSYACCSATLILFWEHVGLAVEKLCSYSNAHATNQALRIDILDSLDSPCLRAGGGILFVSLSGGNPINYKKGVEVLYRVDLFKRIGGELILFATSFFKVIIFVFILQRFSHMYMFEHNSFFILSNKNSQSDSVIKQKKKQMVC